MPRPGPRPYECVRRAWHSERHQPIRGSIIQEIFRIANDVHHPDTQKNKEWQEKLPLVVLRAEEVIYSKANSEAEYMDLKTLWDRTNDAIDTIIRRDDTPETQGHFLHPCIEAALNLGCVPRRASRSQRHNNPCCYLSSTPGPDKLPDMRTLVNSHLGSSPLLYPGNVTSRSPQLEPRPSALGTKHPVSIFGHALDHPSSDSQTHAWPRFGCVYPLCSIEEQAPPVSETGIDFLHNFVRVVGAREGSENPPGVVCDLTLRLGLSPPPSLDVESFWTHEVEDVGSSSSYQGSKFSCPSPGRARAVNFESSLSSSKDKGYDFFPLGATDDPLDSSSS